MIVPSLNAGGRVGRRLGLGFLRMVSVCNFNGFSLISLNCYLFIAIISYTVC